MPEKFWTFFAAAVCGSTSTLTLCAGALHHSATCVTLPVANTLTLDYSASATLNPPNIDSESPANPSVTSDIVYRMNYCYSTTELLAFFTNQKAACPPGCLWCRSPFSCLNITNTLNTNCYYLSFDCLSCTNPGGCQTCRPLMHLTGLTPNNCTCDNTYYPSPDSTYCQPCHVTCLTCTDNAAAHCLSCFPNAQLPGALTIGTCSCITNKQPMPDASHCSCYPACDFCQGTAFNQCYSCYANAAWTLISGLIGSCVCNTGFYPDWVNTGCSPCHVTCVTCVEATANDCSTCPLHASLPSGSTTGPCTCDVGWYWNAGTTSCSACDPKCRTCSGAAASQCLTCKTDAQLPAGATVGTCSCVAGRVPMIDASNCNCNLACKTCLTSAATDCLSCYHNAALPAGATQGTCTCIAGVSPMPDAAHCGCYPACNTCSGGTVNDCTSCVQYAHQTTNPGACVCDTYYYWNAVALACQSCHSTCQTCTAAGDTDCVLCRTSASLTGTPAKCTCNSGFYPNTTSANCSPCHASCKTCSGSSASQCASCYTNAALSGGLCSCNAHFYPNPHAGTCAACDTSCYTCADSTAAKCTSCALLMHLSSTSPSTCVCDTTAYYVSPGNCSPCHATCASCTGAASSTCNSCKSGAKLAAAAPSSCVCLSNYFTLTDTAHCQPCHYTCATCSSSADVNKCTSCITNMHLSGASPNTCICDDKTYPTATGCDLCDSTCVTCSASGSSACTSCPANSSLMSGSCVCSVGYFLNISVCNPCSVECLTCSNSSASSCLTCKPNSYLSSSGSTPGSCLCNVGTRRVDTSGYCVSCRQFFKSNEISAYIDSTYTKLIITFQRAVESDSLLTCESVFQPATIVRLGTAPRCIWSKDSKSLTVTLGQGYLLRAETVSLYLRDIAGAGNDCSAVYYDFAPMVNFQATKLPPVAVIAAANVYSLACATGLKLSAAGSYNTSGQPATYKWTITQTPIGSDILAYSQYAADYLEVTVDNSLLQGTQLNVTLWVKDFLGKEGTAWRNVTVISGAGMDLYVSALSPVRVRRAQGVWITAAAVLLCGADKTKAVSYLWELVETSPMGQSLTFSPNSATLSLSPFSLSTSASYLFRITASSSSLQCSSLLSLSVLSSPLEIHFDRSDGDHIVTSDLSIDASSTRDPDDHSAAISFKWQCLENNGACTDRNGAQLALSLAANLNIAKDLLRLGARYEFTLFAFSGDKSSSAGITMRIVNNTNASVKIPGDVVRVPPLQSVVYIPSVTSDQSLSFIWVQTAGPALQFSTPATLQWLKIPEGQIQSGTPYRFSLVLSNGVMQNVTIAANLSPALGWVACTPSSGTAASTVFSVAALGWDDPDGTDYPLMYQFGVQGKNNVEMASLLQLRYEYSAVLFPGALTLVATVCDSLYACGSATTMVTVSRPAPEPKLADIQSQLTQLWVSPASSVPAFARTYSSLPDQGFFDQLLSVTNYFFSSLPSIDNSALSAHITACASLCQLSNLTTVDNISKVMTSLTASVERLSGKLTAANQVAALSIFANLTEARNVSYALLGLSGKLRSGGMSVPEETPFAVSGGQVSFASKEVLTSTAEKLNTKAGKVQIDFPADFLTQTSIATSSVCEVQVMQLANPSETSPTVSVSLTSLGYYQNYGFSTQSRQPLAVSSLSTPVNLTIPLNHYDVNKSYSAYTKADSSEEWEETGVTLIGANYTHAVIAVTHFSSFKVDITPEVVTPLPPPVTVVTGNSSNCVNNYAPVYVAGVQVIALIVVWGLRKVKCKKEKFDPTNPFVDESKPALKPATATPPSSAPDRVGTRSAETTPNFSARRIHVEERSRAAKPSFMRRTVHLNPVFGLALDRKAANPRMLIAVSLFIIEELALGVANQFTHSDWKSSDIPGFQASSWSLTDYISCLIALGCGLAFSLTMVNLFQVARNRKLLKRMFYCGLVFVCVAVTAVIAWMASTGCDELLNLWTGQTLGVMVVEAVASSWISGALSAALRGVEKKEPERDFK